MSVSKTILDEIRWSGFGGLAEQYAEIADLLPMLEEPEIEFMDNPVMLLLVWGRGDLVVSLSSSGGGAQLSVGVPGGRMLVFLHRTSAELARLMTTPLGVQMVEVLA